MDPAEQHHADISIEQVTSGTSDGVLRDTLDRTPTMLAAAQRAAHAAYDAARAARGVPVERIEKDWATFCVRFRAAAPAPGTRTRSMIDFFGRVAQLRVALQARTHFRTIAEVTAADLAQTAARSQARPDARGELGGSRTTGTGVGAGEIGHQGSAAPAGSIFSRLRGA